MIRKRRALSPVIATVIITGVVLAIGSGLWGFALSASSAMADDYVNGTLNLLYEITERFTVEHVSNSSNGDALLVWVYNYGPVNITVTVNAEINDGNNGSITDQGILAGEIIEIQIPFPDNLEQGDEIAVKVYSKRQNNAYYIYYV
ncbi:hypothetical protein KAU18_08400 [Candidatus Bathyarchaeota archaeon]|nr:hypothetical protein [Candidatus Bathyarchaeota archaeon]